MPWQYEPSPDKKHKRQWDQAFPGFVLEGGEIVGKCPTTISGNPGLAEKLINDENRIEYSHARWDHSYPERIYVIYEGQLYRATRTTPGRSYHGFPELPSDALQLPRNLKNRILDRARLLGCEAEVAKCLKGK